MSQYEKLIQKMKQQVNAIKFNEVAKCLNIMDILWKNQSGTSHRHFMNGNGDGDVITIKYENPLKAVYVKDVLKRISE